MTDHPLLLTPNTSSKLIISQYQRKSLQFYCYSPKEYDIELWTNLSDKTAWTGLAFIQVRPNEYFLGVNTSDLLPGDYEFTLRFKSPNHRTSWHWYGRPGQNGIVRIIPYAKNLPTTPTFDAVPQLRFVAKEHMSGADLVHYSTLSKEAGSSGATIASFSLSKIDQSIHGYVSLIRKGSTWLTPVAGHDTFCNKSPLEKWQMLLYQDGDEGNIHLWVPMSQKGDCWLSPEQDKQVHFHHTNDKEAHLLIVTTTIKQNFAQIIRSALAYYRKSILNEETIEYSSSDSILLDKLGYCTWNAFGKELTMEKLQMAIESLKIHDIPIGYLLLDDGWQRVSSTDQLVDFDACSDKFPDGLKRSISQLKLAYPAIQSIGVWHILWGYWNGIDKALANKLGCCDWKAYQTQSSNNSGIGIANDSRRFFQNFYAFLEDAGVDFVKVDNQGGFQDLDVSHHLRTCLWDSYRRDMIESVDQFFNGRVLHCMALAPHILLHPILSQKGKAILRNSDDFFPNEMKSHSWHIYANAINSLLTSQLEFTGDWDMFQSDHVFAEYHASSRAISGGPIYITDLPYKHNTSLIQRLVGETRKRGYAILRSQNPPQPTFETVFGDPMASQSLLAVYNLHHEQQWTTNETEYGVCGFWNTGPKEQLGVVSSDLFYSSNKLLTVPAVAFVVSGPDQGKLAFLDLEEEELGIIINSTNIRSDHNNSFTLKENQLNLSSSTSFRHHGCESLFMSAMTARVSPFGSTLVSVSPIISTGIFSIACLGLIDKFNGTKAIAKTNYVERDIYDYSYEATLYQRSSACGFWIHLENSTSLLDLLSVQMDGVVLEPMKDWHWCSASGLLITNMMAVSLEASLEDTFRIQINVGRF